LKLHQKKQDLMLKLNQQKKIEFWISFEIVRIFKKKEGAILIAPLSKLVNQELLLNQLIVFIKQLPPS